MTTTTEAILSGLGRLDPANDEHWTKDGLPAVKALEQIVGEPGLTRAAIDEAAPGFTRDVAFAAAPPPGPDTPKGGPMTTTTEADDDESGEVGEEVVERQATLAECNAMADRIHAEVGVRDTITRRRPRQVVIQTAKP